MITMFSCISYFILVVIVRVGSVFCYHLAQSLAHNRHSINICRVKDMYIHLVSLVKLPIPGGQRRRAMLLLSFPWCLVPCYDRLCGTVTGKVHGDDAAVDKGQREERKPGKEEREEGERQQERII